MSLSAGYHLRNSLPGRNSASRSHLLSSSDYQPISFDRDALESAYQTSLSQPTSSSASSRTGPSLSSMTHDTSDTPDTVSSTLTTHLKPGDNPHTGVNTYATPDPPSTGSARCGAGHSLTPPQSPLREDGQRFQRTLLSPVPPSPPARPGQIPESTYQADSSQQSSSQSKGEVADRTNRESHGYTDGYASDPGSQGALLRGRSSGMRRDLPPVPTNVPVPVSHHPPSSIIQTASWSLVSRWC